MKIPCWCLLTLFAFVPCWVGGSVSDDRTSFLEVRNGREMAIAFASSARIDGAIIVADVWMIDRDWHGLLDGSEPITLNKNFTILGSPSLPDWPVLNMGFVHGKIRIGNGVTLTVRHVVVGDFRSDLLTQAPGFDLATPTPDGPSGILVHNETAVLYSVCLPTSFWTSGLNTSRRAASRAGVQNFSLGVPQHGCTNLTAETATPVSHPPSQGLALQPRLNARCWPDRGMFIDVAVPGADVAISGSSTVPNNYDVILINVTYMCARVMTRACIVQYKGLLPCALSIVQNDTAPQPWRLSAPAEVSVRSGRELAAALAAAPMVTSIVVEQDIWMHEADWEGFLGGSNGSEPALISRYLMVYGSPRLASWPLINLGFVKAKIRVASNVTFIVRRLLVADFCNEAPARALGFDLAASTQLSDFDTTPAVVALEEAALLHGLCAPAATWNSSLASGSRAVSRPGSQTFTLQLSQAGCVMVDASTRCTSSGGVLQPPLASRCWADRGILLDVALPGTDVDETGTQKLTEYDIVLINVSYICAYVMTNECVRDHGDVMGCSTWMHNQLAEQVLPWQQSGAGQPLQLASAATGGSGKSAAEIGGAVGGAVLLALLTAVAILFVRRRSRQAGRQYAPRSPPGALTVTTDGKAGEAPDGGSAAAAGEEGSAPPNPRKSRSKGKSHPCLPLATVLLYPAAKANASAADVAGTTAIAANVVKSMPVATDPAKASDSVAGGGGGVDGSGSGYASASGEDDSGGAGDAGAAKARAKTSRFPGASEMGLIDPAAAVTRAGLVGEGDGKGGRGPGPEYLAGPGGIASTSDQTGDLLTRSAGPSSCASGQRPPRPQNSTAFLQPEDDHVVVTPLTPPRPDLAVGEAAAQEVTLLPVVRGKGAFGRVYEGMYGGERVAVKVMRDLGDAVATSGNSLEHIRNSFAQEVEVLGRCQHPNVVRLLAACLTPPKLLLVMELMETSLEKLVYSTTGDLLPLRTVLYIAHDIAKGLEYLHPTILHRDLKPGNVLINGQNSPRPVAKITDFGVSRLRSTVLITKHPEAGTPAYMAPETFDVRNYTLTHHVDMYSFGVLLWVLLTGEHPWKGFQMVEVAYKVTINRERLPTLRIPSSRCPLKLRALMEQCWEYEPRRRPAAAEAVKDIQSLLEAMV